MLVDSHRQIIDQPRLTCQYRDGVESFCKALVEESGVLLLPASIYRSELLKTPQDRFRVGFGRNNMGEGLAAFVAFLEEHQARFTP